MSSFAAHVLTLFPEMFPGPLGHSLAGKALEQGLWSLTATNIRDFATDKHQSVDDDPYGGGAGMVMRPDVVDAALESQLESQLESSPGSEVPLVYLTPRGEPFHQAMAHDFVEQGGIRLLCGRYEGLDERVLEKWSPKLVSLGDFVLSGGEMAALTILDACVRLIPGVVNTAESLEQESFETGLLEHPLYTRPQNWAGKSVPDVLLSGDHKKIAQWRLDKSLELTQKHRPDLSEAFKRNKETKS